VSTCPDSHARNNAGPEVVQLLALIVLCFLATHDAIVNVNKKNLVARTGIGGELELSGILQDTVFPV